MSRSDFDLKTFRRLTSNRQGFSLGRVTVLAWVVFGSTACDGSGVATAQPDDPQVNQSNQMSQESEVVSDSESQSNESAIAPVAANRCAEWNLAIQAFQATAGDIAFEQKVPNLEFQTRDGRWTLAENWSGCDNYLFALIGNDLKGREFAKSPVEELFNDAAGNTHYFFIPKGFGAVRVSESGTQNLLGGLFAHPIKDLEKSLDEALAKLAPELANHWRSRVHIVSQPADSLPWLSGMIERDPRLTAFAIDRRQQLREGRNLKYLEIDEANKRFWWEGRISHLRFLSNAFNYEVHFEKQLAEQPLIENVKVAEKLDIPSKTVFEAPFPSADALARATHIDIEMQADCPGDVHPHKKHCGEWDTTGFLYFCADESPSEKSSSGKKSKGKKKSQAHVDATDDCQHPVEVFRWITPYASPGHWVSDSAPLLSLLKQQRQRHLEKHGVEPKQFKFKVRSHTYTYKYTLNLRLRQDTTQGTLVPFAELPVYPTKDYPFTPDYDKNFPSFRFTPPPGTKRVQLVSRTTGHGMTDPEGCAEFCSHEHHVTVNSQEFSVEYPMAKEDHYFCAKRINEGVTANQFGTWFFARAAWCPGFKVDPWAVDVTSSVDLSGKNTIRYRGTHNGDKPPGKGAVMHTGLWLVFWK